VPAGDDGADWSAEQLGDPEGKIVAVFIHGGFWRARYGAETIAPLAAACARLGHWAWNIEYPRVGMPGGGWPGTALAVRAAITAAVAAAADRPVMLVGHSAGGHLALWGAGEAAGSVSAVISLAGVCDLESATAGRLGDDAVVAFLGGEPGPELYAAASPIARLPLGVPALLIHGDADDSVPITQSRAYLAAARAAGDRCELHELSGGDHFEPIDAAGRAWPIIAARVAELARGADR
jgi:acetyl esterase/lipase